MNPGFHNAAIFVDYQDVYFHLRQEPGYPHENVHHLLETLRGHLHSQRSTQTLSCTAIADFESLPDSQQVQNNLYMQGVMPCFVPAAHQKNVVDLQLCIEVMDTISNKVGKLDTIVLVSGSRDYLPLVQYIYRSGFQVLLVGFRYTPSVALVQSHREDDYIDGNALLKSAGQARRPARNTADTYRAGSPFMPIQELPYEMDRFALEVIEIHFGHYKEIYLSPLLRKLSEEMDENDGHEPKSLIGDLEEAGAVRLEKRRGVEHDYTVLIVNTEHPEVIAIRTQESQTHSFDTNYDDESYAETWEKNRSDWDESD
jgi:hypothetical protein